MVDPSGVGASEPKGARLTTTPRSDPPGDRTHGEPLRSVRIRLHGEIDITTGDATYRACTAVPAAAVVVDLADVTFMDSAGSLAFLRARDRLVRDGGSLMLVGAQGGPARLLAILDAIGEDAIRQLENEFRSVG